MGQKSHTWAPLRFSKVYLLCIIEIFFHKHTLLGTNVSNLDPHWEYGSGSRRAKMTHKSEENSSFEMLEVHFGGLKASPVA